MCRMAKDRGEQSPRSEPRDASRRKRSVPAEPNGAFLLALADALRDILHDEQHRAA